DLLRHEGGEVGRDRDVGDAGEDAHPRQADAGQGPRQVDATAANADLRYVEAQRDLELVPRALEPLGLDRAVGPEVDAAALQMSLHVVAGREGAEVLGALLLPLHGAHEEPYGRAQHALGEGDGEVRHHAPPVTVSLANALIVS